MNPTTERASTTTNPNISHFIDYVLARFQNDIALTAQQSQRLQGLLQQLLQALEQGDSAIECSAEDVQDLSQWLAQPATAQAAPCPLVYHHGRLSLYRYWSLEQRLAARIQHFCQHSQHNPQNTIDCTAALHLLQDPHQRAAMQLACDQQLSLITGGPGTGKTYTLARIIACLHRAQPTWRIAMAAPTGKAAQRMQEALQIALQSPELCDQGWVTPNLQRLATQTLHRLLGIGLHDKPRFNLSQPLAYDVIVVDEASMLDLSLATALFEAVPDHARIILLGDAQQLAAVDVGQVLADLQHSASLANNRVHLHNSRRFVAEAAIGRMAKILSALSLGEMPLNDAIQAMNTARGEIKTAGQMHRICPSNTLDRVQYCQLPVQSDTALQQNVVQALLQGYTAYVAQLKHYMAQPSTAQLQQLLQAFDQYRILTATNVGQWGVDRINLLVSRFVAQQSQQMLGQEWYVGRAVMMTYNDYQLGLSNGDVGICVYASEQLMDPSLEQRSTSQNGSKQRFVQHANPQQVSADLQVYFASLQRSVPVSRLPKNIVNAYALTIHKSQGSEFEHCAVLLTVDSARLLSRELLYTAITRAKRMVSLWCDDAAFNQAICIDSQRVSGLQALIEQQA